MIWRNENVWILMQDGIECFCTRTEIQTFNNNLKHWREKSFDTWKREFDSTFRNWYSVFYAHLILLTVEQFAFGRIYPCIAVDLLINVQWKSTVK